MLLGCTNPMVLVFSAAVLPQFTDPTAGSPVTQILVLGLLFALIVAVLDSGWRLAAGRLRT